MKDIIIEEKVEKVVTEKTPTSWYQNSVINTREFRESMASFNYVIDGHDVIITSLNCFEEEVVVPMGVTKIGKYAFSSKDFYSRDIESVKLSKTVYEIEEGAFCNNDCIKSIDMESVLKIGKDAFKGCVELEEVGLSACLNEIGANAFDRGSQCEKEMSIVIPNHTKWPKNAFDKKTEVLLWKYYPPIEEKIETYYTDKIESIKQKYKTLKDDIKKGYNEQFTAYKNAVENELKQKLQALKNQKTELERLRKKEEKASKSTPKVDNVKEKIEPNSEIVIPSIKPQKAQKTFEPKTELIEIKDNVCVLENIDLLSIKDKGVVIEKSENRAIVFNKENKTVYLIGAYEEMEMPRKFFKVVKKCNSIVFNEHIPTWGNKNVKKFNNINTVTVNKVSAFRYNNFTCFANIKNLYINNPGEVKIFSGCFKDNATLQSVDIKTGQGKICIYEEAFMNNSSLKEFNFIDVETIEKRAFEHCKNLVSPIVSKHLKKIKNEAFLDCKSLTMIELLNKDLVIDSHTTFSYCINLKRVILGIDESRKYEIKDETIRQFAKIVKVNKKGELQLVPKKLYTSHS